MWPRKWGLRAFLRDLRVFLRGFRAFLRYLQTFLRDIYGEFGSDYSSIWFSSRLEVGRTNLISNKSIQRAT